jgi:hypothetical protein
MDSDAREGGSADEGNCCTTEASGEEGGHGWFDSSEWLEGLAPKRNHPRALLLQTNEWIGLDAEPWVALLAAWATFCQLGRTETLGRLGSNLLGLSRTASRG